MDLKKKYLNISVIIFAVIYGGLSVLIGDWIEKVLVWINDLLNLLFTGFLWILSFPGQVINRIGLSGQSLIFKVILGILIAWIIAPWILKIFNLMTKWLFNKQFFKEN